MSFFSGGLAQGAPRAGMYNASASRSDILGRKYQPFSNPFFDLASTYTPPTVKGLFGFCRHYHLTHGIINAIGTKASEYPITDIILQHRDKAVVGRWDELLNGVLNYRVQQFEINLDYHVYGQAFVSPSLPFTKMLSCASCRQDMSAEATRANWRYNQQGFWLSCPKCGQTGWAKARDDYYPKLGGIGLTRWNPELVNIFYNEATGRTDYSLDFSAEFRNGIATGRKDLVATTPQVILEAVRTQRTLVFDSNAVFHFRRPGLSGSAKWGIPLMMPVLKDAFFMQIMKKSQEAILLTELVPQNFVFPQPATSGADPFSTASLADWRDHIRREMARQRMDPAYVGILPFPLGHQTIGGQGKSLMLMPEIQSMAEHICVGMGFPTNLVFGDGTYAGSSVSMRMLENFFLGNVHGHKRLLHWLLKHYGTFLNWPLPDARAKAFRMADDVQRQALMLQMAQQDIISETTLLGQADLKVEDESALRIAELTVKAEAAKKKASLTAQIQGEAQVIAAKYQAQAQGAAQAATVRDAAARKSPFEAVLNSGLSGPTGVSLDAVAAALAKEIQRMPPERREAYLSQLRSQTPEMEQLVQQQQGAGLPAMPEDPLSPAPQGQQQAPQADMRPQPDVLPPRRPGGV